VNTHDALPAGQASTICTQCGLRARPPIIKQINTRHDNVPIGECVNKAACKRRQFKTKQRLDQGEYVHE
jgi:hypothetical protein